MKFKTVQMQKLCAAAGLPCENPAELIGKRILISFEGRHLGETSPTEGMPIEGPIQECGEHMFTKVTGLFTTFGYSGEYTWLRLTVECARIQNGLLILWIEYHPHSNRKCDWVIATEPYPDDAKTDKIHRVFDVQICD